MTSTSSRGRSPRVSPVRRAPCERDGRPAHIYVRVAHTVLGATAGVVWLVLPVMTISAGVPVAVRPVLPLAAVGGAGAVGGYVYLRRSGAGRTGGGDGVGGGAGPEGVNSAERGES